MSPAPRVAIHYRRPPDDVRVYHQRIVLARDDVVVTLSQPLDLEGPMRVDGRVALERGSLAVWFTFPGAWHDIGRFHRADGTFTGIYANVVTPVRMSGSTWRTTDLFLDVWWPAGGRATLLDEDELVEAIRRGHVDESTAARAREEAERLLGLADEGGWPPAVVDDWTLTRSLERMGEGQEARERPPTG